MRSSRKCTAWVWTRVFYPSTQDNSFPCSHSLQRTELQDTLAISLPTVEKWKRKKERVWTLILPIRLPCLSQVSFTSASLHEKFLRGDTAMWEGKTSSHSLAWQKSLTERNENTMPTTYKTVIPPPTRHYDTLLFSKHKIQLILEKATTLFKPKITFGFLDRLPPLHAWPKTFCAMGNVGDPC